MTTSELFRRDPPKGKKEFSADKGFVNKGFTVIELMISIGVIAIIASLALPSYRALIEKREVTSGSQQVAAFLSAAQLEAVKRNQPVAVACAIDSGCEAIMLDDEGGNSDVSLRTLGFVNLKAGVVGVEYGGDDEQVVFDPVRGMLIEADIGPNPLEIQFESTGQMYALNVRLTPTGRVTLCSDMDRADHAVPGYIDCAEGGP